MSRINNLRVTVKLTIAFTANLLVIGVSERAGKGLKRLEKYAEIFFCGPSWGRDL